MPRGLELQVEPQIGGRRKRNKNASALKRLIIAARKKGMSMAELIKFLVTRPDRKRRKKRAAPKAFTQGKIVQPGSQNGPKPPDYTKLGQKPEGQGGPLDAFLGIVPVTRKVAEAAPAGTAMVVRVDKAASDGLMVMDIDDDSYEYRAGDKFFVQRGDKMISAHKYVEKGIKHVNKELKDAKSEKESAKKDADIAKRKADELTAAEKKRIHESTERAVRREAIVIMKVRWNLNDLRAIAKKNTGDYDDVLRLIVEDKYDEKKADAKGVEAVKARWLEALSAARKTVSEEAAAAAERKQSGKGKAIPPLMTTDIDAKMKDIPGFVGAIARDEEMVMPKDPPRSGVSWVMNMDKAGMPGSHWVAVVITPTSVCYCDSFGDEPPADVREKIIHAGTHVWPEHPHKTFKVNRVPHQDVRTATCGYHAMKFIVEMCRDGKSFPAATGYDSLKGQVRQDEKEIRAFAAKFPKFHQVGDGSSMPATVRKALAKIGDFKIVNMTVVREPIQSAIRSILDGLTAGKFSEVVKEKGYDKMFHLSLYIRCEPPGGDGKGEQVWKTEKGPIVSLTKENVKLGKDVETKQTTAPGGRTVNDLFARKDDAGFWQYSAFTNNCQDYIMSLLKAVRADRPEVAKFVKQDAAAIGKKLGWFANAVSQAVTDVGGAVSDVIDDGKAAMSGGERIAKVLGDVGWHVPPHVKLGSDLYMTKPMVRRGAATLSQKKVTVDAA